MGAVDGAAGVVAAGARIGLERCLGDDALSSSSKSSACICSAVSDGRVALTSARTAFPQPEALYSCASLHCEEAAIGCEEDV